MDVPAVGVNALFPAGANAASVPAGLTDATVLLTNLDAVPTGIAELSHGVIRMMLVKKLVPGLAGVVVVAAGMVGLAAGYSPAPAEEFRPAPVHRPCPCRWS